MHKTAIFRRRIFNRRTRADAFTYALVAGALLRVALALTTINFGDLYVYTTTAEAGAAHLFLYHDTLFTYPPLVGYYFQGLGRLFSLLHVSAFDHAAEIVRYTVRTLITAELVKPWALFLIKLPAMAFDGVVAYQAYLLASQRNGRQGGRVAALAIWLNPIFIFSSAVQASWDSVIPMAILGMILTLLRADYASGGAWLGFGFMAKLMSVFAIPSLGAAALGRRGSPAAKAAAGVAAAIGFIVIVAASLVPVFYWHGFHIMFGSIFARTGLFSVGGPNLWSLAALPSFGWINAFAANHRVVIARASLATQAAAALWTFLLCYRRPSSIGVLAGTTAFMMGIVILTSPFVQPNYVIWVVPMIVVASGTVDRVLFWGSWVYSVVAFLYIATIRLPQGLLLPACRYFHVCSVTDFAHQNFIYNTAPGHFSGLIQVDIDAALGEICGVLLVVLLVALTRKCLLRPETDTLCEAA